MAEIVAIRGKIDSFFKSNGDSVHRLEDAFAPWVLHTRYKLPIQEAHSQCSDGNHDGGIDGFTLMPEGEVNRLHVIQAKLSENEGVVRKGLDDLSRASRLVEKLLAADDSDLPSENRVIQQLRIKLATLPPEQRAKVEVRFVLAHLLQDEELWLSKSATSKAKTELLKELSQGSLAGRSSIEFVGPRKLDDADVIPKPAATVEVHFEGTTFAVPSSGNSSDTVLLGLGRLGDYVKLHEVYGAQLFAKNVRMFLSRQAAESRSAASHIRETILGICKGEIEPETFALLHNGLTVTASSGAHDASSRRATLRPGSDGIYVVNGCQTVYMAWKVHRELLKKKLDTSWLQRWDRIMVPIRVVLTNSDERVRQVTSAANRQTAMAASAFYAHEPAQMELADRFDRMKVYYERQEGAWDHMNRADPNRAASYTGGAVEIELVARSIAAASPTVKLDLAKSPQRIFETEENYARIFKTERHRRSVRLLLFAVNAFRATKLALQDLTREHSKYYELAPSRFVFPVTRLLIGWIAKNDPDLVREYSTALAPLYPASAIRSDFRLRLKYQHSGLQQLLPDIWLEGDEWAEALDAERLRVAQGKLKIDKVDAFDVFAELDDEED